MWWLLFLKCKMNKLGLVYTAGPTFLLYISHLSLEKWILPLNPEGKKIKIVSGGTENWSEGISLLVY